MKYEGGNTRKEKGQKEERKRKIQLTSADRLVFQRLQSR